MSMRGNCRCNNIEVVWRTVDFSIVPRACQCDYCRAKGAAYVSKTGTAIDMRINNTSRYRIVARGSGGAAFHECDSCGELVLVTTEIDGELYGALNANCMDNRLGFPPAVDVDYAGQTVAQKLERWRRNWCRPVRITH
jgi:hypothetical protein